jgi:hypothetical protein
MEEDELLMFLEGNLLEEWVDIRMVILVLDSLIFWDHSYPSNYLILSYILRAIYAPEMCWVPNDPYIHTTIAQNTWSSKSSIELMLMEPPLITVHP